MFKFSPSCTCCSTTTCVRFSDDFSTEKEEWDATGFTVSSGQLTVSSSGKGIVDLEDFKFSGLRILVQGKGNSGDQARIYINATDYVQFTFGTNLVGIYDGGSIVGDTETLVLSAENFHNLKVDVCQVGDHLNVCAGLLEANPVISRRIEDTPITWDGGLGAGATAVNVVFDDFSITTIGTRNEIQEFSL